MIDCVAAMESVTVRSKHKALVGSCEIAGSPIILAKPQTYMCAWEEIKPPHNCFPSALVVMNVSDTLAGSSMEE